ncbi:MAG: sugar phosphate isomerase/epimerase [Bryobacterales bacterium]|nr:sugar phosphate isomerase/epimerase [Bryobacterales bacterium]
MLTRRELLVSSAAAAGLSRSARGAAARMYVSLNSSLLGSGKLGWPDFARLAAKLGYGGVDFNLNAAMMEGLEPTRALLAGLRIKPAVCGLPVAATRGDAAAFQESMQGLAEAAQFAAAVGCPRMTLVVSPGSQIPKEEQRKMLGDRLRQISEVLAKSGVRLGLEFLGPLPLRAKASYQFIYRMDEMLEFAKECGPNIGLLLDSWHWHHAGATVQDILSAGKSRIVTVHVSDAAKMPPEEVRDNQRLMPGEGIIDFTGFFQALQKIGYEDGVSPEVLGRVPKDMAPEEGAKLGLDTTLAVMRKAGVA